MRKALWTCVSVVLLIGVMASHGWAVERELWGVRLGARAMDLLDKPGYGQPHFIGPLGAIRGGSEQAAVGGRVEAGRLRVPGCTGTTGAPGEPPSCSLSIAKGKLSPSRWREAGRRE